MVTTAAVGLVASLLVFVLNSLPAWAAPDWLGGVAGSIQAVLAYAVSVSVWLPFSDVQTGITAVLLATMVGAAIRTVRMTLSLMSGGGGSAG